jgi:hypothetical protein
VNNICVKTGPLQFSLVWDRPGDLDLRVLTPSGQEINYTQRIGAGAEMDRDDRRGTGPENVFFAAQPPPGTYAICVDSRLRGTPAPTATFSVTVRQPNGQNQTFTGTRTGSTTEPCRPGGRTHVANVVISAAPTPPPVVQPPAVQPTAFEITPNVVGAQPRRDVVLQVVGWEGQRQSVGLEGGQFVIATNGDWSRARRDAVLQYTGADRNRYTLRVDRGQLWVAPGTDWNRAVSVPFLQVLGWDGAAYNVRLP